MATFDRSKGSDLSSVTDYRKDGEVNVTVSNFISLCNMSQPTCSDIIQNDANKLYQKLLVFSASLIHALNETH